jgi:hypothetical protein
VRTRSALVAVLAALVAVLGLTGVATAADGVYPPAGVRVVAGSASPTEVVDGGEVDFSGSGYAPGALLRLSIDGVDAGTTTADQRGAFSTVLRPAGLGEHVLAASGLEAGGRVRVVSATVVVIAAASQAGGLPTSGTEALPALLAGLGLVVGGAVVVFAARHRPRTRTV